MKEIDYRKKYKLEKKSIKVGKARLDKAVAQAMEHSTNLGNYSIRKKKDSDLLLFGRDELSQVQLPFNDALLITENQELNRDVPAVVLRYGVYPRQIVVGYIQTPSDVSFTDYSRVKSDLGARPHELIFAHFLDRVSPVLDEFPNTNVFFSPIYLGNPVYPFLRDRFLDSDYLLNLNRERVQQILGEENSWFGERISRKRSRAQRGIKRKLLYNSNFLDLFV